MELDEWRGEVPHGERLQDIHLQVGETDAGDKDQDTDHVPAPKTKKKGAKSRKKKAQPDTEPNPAAEVADTTSRKADSNTSNTKPTTDATTTLVLPPFASECMNDGLQMALNVGGPVWAMDWLPETTTISSEENITPTNQLKKTKRTSARGRAVRGKENNRNEAEEKVVDTKNAPLEWKFLALSTHPPCQVADGRVVKPTPPDHYYDAPEGARNLVQIWAVPVHPKKAAVIDTKKKGKKAAKKEPVKPRMVYAIDHDCGVAWDMQWCPLVKDMPGTQSRQNVLGVLSVCFGDGSVRIFEVPSIPHERLKAQLPKKSKSIVEKNVPIVVAKLPRVLQLSVQWSPFHWNLLLTGGSDGSVSLWNIQTEITRSSDNQQNEPDAIEPQRRYQDADTIGKQDAFDWGCGWVAIRAVAWSPFEENLFATTGNDSVFKVWDVREPRLCLRSHRIRSTWGLALQWLDQTSIQISGDQGSIYVYDILSGSYQKLHYHPQIDSPVWDLQFGRRGSMPLLVSSCASGSIRAAPARKLYRAPQNSVEICRLSGSKAASVEQQFKSLTVSFEKTSIVGPEETVGTGTREFCERDAALHRLRITSTAAGVYPCYLAAAGHAGLVVILELQGVLDDLIDTYFLPPKRRKGKRLFAPIGGHGPKKSPTSNGVATGAGRRSRTLGSFAKAKGMRTTLKKYTKGTKGKAKLSQAKKKAFINDDEDVEVDGANDEEEEPEFNEDDEDEASESDLSLEDNSEDDAVSASDNDSEATEANATETNQEESRLRAEYQLDLSEEDAILLAIQMSQAEADNKESASSSSTKTSASTNTSAGPENKKPARRSKAESSATASNPSAELENKKPARRSKAESSATASNPSAELENKKPARRSKAESSATASNTSTELENKKPARPSKAEAPAATSNTSAEPEVKKPVRCCKAEAPAATGNKKRRERTGSSSATTNSTPAKRPRAKAPAGGAATKKRRTAPTPRGRRRANAGNNLSEEDALALALQISAIEY